MYPVKSLCVSSLFWTDIKKVEYVSIENEVWTKGWPDYTRSIDNDSKQKISKEMYLKNLFWLPYWSQNHLKKILNILLPYLAFLLILIFIFHLIKKKSKRFIVDKTLIVLIILMSLSTLFWLIKVPVFRYGYSYIISLISFLFAYSSIHFDFKKSAKNIFNILIIFLITIILTKNLVRIIYTKNDYNNHPWPKYYSMNEDNQRADFKINKLGDKIILNPINGYCMYSSEICSNYKLDEKLKIKKINSYYFFYKK